MALRTSRAPHRARLVHEHTSPQVTGGPPCARRHSPHSPWRPCPQEPPELEEGQEPPPPPPIEWQLGTSLPSDAGELLLRGFALPAEVPLGPATLTIREATEEIEPIAFPRIAPVELQVTIEPPPPADGEEPPPEDPKKGKKK